MKKLAFIPVVIVIIVIAFFTQESKVKSNDPRIQVVGNRVYYSGQPFSGTLLEHYLNGDLYRETHYKNGLKEGSAREYGLQGVLRAVWNYHMDKKEGTQVGWFEEGPKRFEYHYKAGLFEGPQVEWHMNGQIFRNQIFQNGVEIGKKIFYQGAEIFTNYTIRNGRSYGLDGGALCFDVKKDGEK